MQHPVRPAMSARLGIMPIDHSSRDGLYELLRISILNSHPLHLLQVLIVLPSSQSSCLLRSKALRRICTIILVHKDPPLQVK